MSCSDGVTIRPARRDEGERLRDIAFRSKAHWGYDEEWVRRWVAQGDLSAATLEQNETFVAEASGEPIAWAMLVPRESIGWLEDLWVEPRWIGHGIGRLLFERVARRAYELGASRLEWEAEPNAVGFYERVGGRHLRDSGVTELGRVLSVMSLELKVDQRPRWSER